MPKVWSFYLLALVGFEPAISERSERRLPVRTGLNVQLLPAKSEIRAISGRARIVNTQ